MIFAKTNPAAKACVQADPFNVTVFDAPYFTASAQSYKLGQSSTRFEVVFGDFVQPPIQPDVPAEPPFKRMVTTMIEFSSEELAGWGVDDVYVLEKIASSYGIEILEILIKDDTYSV